LVPGLLLTACSVVVLIGAAVTLLDARRSRAHPAPAGVAEVRARLHAELDLSPLLACLGLAALAVLGGALVASRTVASAEVALVVVVLGLAADRAGYLARTRTTGSRRAVWVAAITTLLVVVGVVLGSTV